MACRSGEKVKIMYLVNLGANIESRTNGGYTPLMFAVMSGDLYAVELCLNCQMNPF